MKKQEYTGALWLVHRGGFLQDQGDPTQSLRPDSGGPGRGAGRSIIRSQLPGCPGILRARRLPSYGSITMKDAVGASSWRSLAIRLRSASLTSCSFSSASSRSTAVASTLATACRKFTSSSEKVLRLVVYAPRTPKGLSTRDHGGHGAHHPVLAQYRSRGKARLGGSNIAPTAPMHPIQDTQRPV